MGTTRTVGRDREEGGGLRYKIQQAKEDAGQRNHAAGAHRAVRRRTATRTRRGSVRARDGHHVALARPHPGQSERFGTSRDPVDTLGQACGRGNTLRRWPTLCTTPSWIHRRSQLQFDFCRKKEKTQKKREAA